MIICKFHITDDQKENKNFIKMKMLIIIIITKYWFNFIFGTL
jgi:hypothetical protein